MRCNITIRREGSWAQITITRTSLLRKSVPTLTLMAIHTATLMSMDMATSLVIPMPGMRTKSAS